MRQFKQVQVTEVSIHDLETEADDVPNVSSEGDGSGVLDTLLLEGALASRTPRAIACYAVRSPEDWLINMIDENLEQRRAARGNHLTLVC